MSRVQKKKNFSIIKYEKIKYKRNIKIENIIKKINK